MRTPIYHRTGRKIAMIFLGSYGCTIEKVRFSREGHSIKHVVFTKDKCA